MTQDHVQLQALVLMLLNVWGYATTLLIIQCLMISNWKKKIRMLQHTSQSALRFPPYRLCTEFKNYTYIIHSHSMSKVPDTPTEWENLQTDKAKGI